MQGALLICLCTMPADSIILCCKALAAAHVELTMDTWPCSGSLGLVRLTTGLVALYVRFEKPAVEVTFLQCSQLTKV